MFGTWHPSRVAVECVARFEDDLFARIDLEHRLELRMPAVMSSPRFVRQMPRPINLYSLRHAARLYRFLLPRPSV